MRWNIPTCAFVEQEQQINRVRIHTRECARRWGLVVWKQRRVELLDSSLHTVKTCLPSVNNNVYMYVPTFVKNGVHRGGRVAFCLLGVKAGDIRYPQFQSLGLAGTSRRMRNVRVAHGKLSEAWCPVVLTIFVPAWRQTRGQLALEASPLGRCRRVWLMSYHN